jgi:hypothetical protein
MMHMSTDADDAVADYLDDLRDALIGAPRPRRRELVAEIEAHIAQARGELDDPFDEIAVRNLLERLGDPAQIAAEEIGAPPTTPTPPAMPAPPSSGAAWREPAAIVLLLFGAFAGGIGWLVGVVLLWASPRWTTGDKLVGTLLWPGGLAVSFLVVAFYAGESIQATPCFEATTAVVAYDACPDNGRSAIEVAALGLFALAPVLTATFLALRLKPRDA